MEDLIVVATPDGNEVRREPAPKPLRRALAVVRALQRRAARQRGRRDPHAERQRDPSAGRARTQRAVAAAHARVANLRTGSTNSPPHSRRRTPCWVETLAVKNMMAAGGARNRGLNRSLADASLGQHLRMIGYKAGWYGATAVKADRWHPSSKTCCGCGAVRTKLRLADRH